MAFMTSKISARCLLGGNLPVSGSGCRIELKHPLEKGQSVRLTLYGVEGSTDLTLGAEVRWARPAHDGTQVAGLKFIGTAAVLAGRLLGTVSAGGRVV